MSKEKTLDDLLNEYASKGLSKSEPAKKTSFLGAAKNSIQVHREVKAAARKAEQERLAKERAEAAAKTEREKPVQALLSGFDVSEINLLRIIRENKSGNPLLIVIDIHQHKEFLNEFEAQNCK